MNNKFLSLIKNLTDTTRRLRKMGDGRNVVYTMGKVASTSVYESLDNAIQIHNLDGQLPARNFSAIFTPYLTRYLYESMRWKIFKCFIQKKINHLSNSEKKIRIFSSVRDPIARNLSAYFQNIDESHISGLSDKELFSHFMAFTNHLLPLYWFESEFEHNLGVSVYDYEFDKDKGCVTFENGKYQIMIVQTEKLNSLSKEIKDFFESKNTFFLNSSRGKENVGKNKWYSDYYNRLKMTASFDENFISTIYESRYSKHFFNNDQIKKFKLQWSSSSN